MTGWLPILGVLLTLGTAPVDTRFVQVAPSLPTGADVLRSAGQARAVVLLSGLQLHPFKHRNADRAQLRTWQQPDSVLVKTLARDADVFVFAYAQTVPVGEVADLPELGGNIRHLRENGYTDIVLIGFSAGGLIARQFVEDNPEAGVAKVIQVSSPNVGSSWARMKVIVGASQEPFLLSLTRENRSRVLSERLGKRIPAEVQFVCVVGTGLLYGDGVVSTYSQWPEDLQQQGIPAVVLWTEHGGAVHHERGAQLIARLVREDQPRWDAAQVAATRKRLWVELVGAR